MKIYSLNLVIDTLSKRKKIYTDEIAIKSTIPNGMNMSAEKAEFQSATVALFHVAIKKLIIYT